MAEYSAVANGDWTDPTIWATSNNFAITAVSSGSHTFTIAGDHHTLFTVGVQFRVYTSTANNGVYTTVSSSYDGGAMETTIVVAAVPSAVADGRIAAIDGNIPGDGDDVSINYYTVQMDYDLISASFQLNTLHLGDGNGSTSTPAGLTMVTGGVLWFGDNDSFWVGSCTITDLNSSNFAWGPSTFAAPNLAINLDDDITVLNLVGATSIGTITTPSINILTTINLAVTAQIGAFNPTGSADPTRGNYVVQGNAVADPSNGNFPTGSLIENVHFQSAVVNTATFTDVQFDGDFNTATFVGNLHFTRCGMSNGQMQVDGSAGGVDSSYCQFRGDGITFNSSDGGWSLDHDQFGNPFALGVGNYVLQGSAWNGTLNLYSFMEVQAGTSLGGADSVINVFGGPNGENVGVEFDTGSDFGGGAINVYGTGAVFIDGVITGGDGRVHLKTASNTAGSTGAFFAAPGIRVYYDGPSGINNIIGLGL